MGSGTTARQQLARGNKLCSPQVAEVGGVLRSTLRGFPKNRQRVLLYEFEIHIDAVP